MKLKVVCVRFTGNQRRGRELFKQLKKFMK